LGPRRPLAVLFVLAFVALIATAGVAFASNGGNRGANANVGANGDANGDVHVGFDPDHGGHGHDVAGSTDGDVAGTDDDQVGDDQVGDDQVGDGQVGDGQVGDGQVGDDQGGTDVGTAADDGGLGSTGGTDVPGENQGGGGVTASGVDAPPTPGKAPAAAASGPAPDAAAAAPLTGPVVDALVVTEVVPAVAPGGGDPTAPDALAAVPAIPASPTIPAAVQDGSLVAGLGDLPDLRSVGAVATDVNAGPAGARQILSTGPGRSLLMVAVLLLAIGVFISVHRWMDRGDRKLAAARSGSDVARFR
jgi:hypothetical protein